MSEPAALLIVDDHPVFRRGLTAVLSVQTWVGTIHEASTGAEALRLTTTTAVDVIALDLELPDANGLDLAGQLVRVRPEVRIAVLTMTADDEVVATALQRGIHGYLLKTDDPDQIVAALRTVATGAFALGPGISTAAVFGRLHGPRALPPPLDKVTPRERDLLTFLAAGRSNAYIARRLGIEEKTVRNQMSALYAKIGARDRVEAALRAQQAGLRPE